MRIAVIDNDKIITKETDTPALNNRTGAIVQVLGCG